MFLWVRSARGRRRLLVLDDRQTLRLFPLDCGARVVGRVAAVQGTFQGWKQGMSNEQQSRMTPQTFLAALLQPQRHGSLQRVNVRVVFDDFGQQILRFALPVGLSLDRVCRGVRLERL